MVSSNSQAAIKSALAQNWEEAVRINKELLKKNKEDIDSLTRLAYAYTQVDELEKAKKTYKKILSLDKYNKLALKNLNKIDNISPRHHKPMMREHVHPSLFIEEPGKTKVIQLINLAPNKILSLLNIGETVAIYAKKHSVEIRGNDKSYYGALPDDVAFRMLKFIEAGNTYLACIKNIQKNSVSVFIREMTRGKKLSHQPTFTASTIKEFTPSIQKEIKKTIISEENEIDSDVQEESEE